MPNPFIRKLEAFGPLPDEDRRSLEHVLESTRRVGVDRDLVREGDRPAACQLIVEGFAYRHRIMQDGRRQIMSFEIAGDLCDLHSFLLGQADHSITTLTPCTVASIAHSTLTEWTVRRLAISRALWLASLVDAAISREWIVNVGRRTAHQRAAHLLCEVMQRLHSAGLANGHTHELPFTPMVLADALGLTPVHVNRILQWLRGEELIEFGNGTLIVRNWPGLKQAGEFDPAYLHQIAATGRGLSAHHAVVGQHTNGVAELER